ncbi:unnamed protein product [Blepharisma stoltei]|uniref:Uncharacterized protein n=1 Tax=Blepharisma stoltei TaxID=1481888 RepID=A0AAU9JN70_9CILI|nr:unnamed protein product [Blepharisma stoltei]
MKGSFSTEKALISLYLLSVEPFQLGHSQMKISNSWQNHLAAEAGIPLSIFRTRILELLTKKIKPPLKSGNSS